MPLDVLPGCAALAVAADAAAGEDGGFAGVSEAELVGVVCAWDRVEAHAAARKLAAIAELARRNPAPEDREFTADQVAYALAESRGRAGHPDRPGPDPETRLPGTAAALDDGTITRYKAEIIARATALLDDAEARAAEQKVLDRAARLTPGGLRAAIAAAVMDVAPEKAKERREAAAKDARVERWAEDSGNAALMGCELPPDEVLAADQRITAWAKELRKAGLEGDMDVLRARAFLDLLLGKDSRPRQDARGGGDGTGPGQAGRARGPDASPPSAGPATARTAVRRAGHPDRPAGHRDRPGGPARRDRRDRPGRPVAGPRPGRRGRAQPEDDLVRDRDRRARPRRRARLRPARTQESPETRRTRPARTRPGSPSPRPAGTGRPAATAPGGCAPPDAGPDLIITLESLTTDPCDHRHQASGHDPGVRLKHLIQVRHATCTSPVCRRPAAQCDVEHNTPYEAGGRTCRCNTGPKCRHDHRLKQHPKWKVDQLPDGTFRWTTPAGRTYTTEPTRYPI